MIDLLDDADLLDLRDRARRTDPQAVTREERQRHKDLPAANAELEAWLAEPRHGGGQASVDPAAVGAQCQIVAGRAAKYRCNQCGRDACAEHYWVMFGLCTSCASEERVRRWHGDSRPEDHNWLDEG